MPASSIYEFGAHLANRGSVLWLPHGYKRDGTKRGVAICHGAGELSISGLNVTPAGGGAGTKQAEGSLLQQVASVYPTIMFDGGTFGSGGTIDSDSWGNTNAQTEMDAAITRLLAAAGGGAINGPVIVMGLSMGHALALNYTQASAPNAARVKAIVGILPVNDLDDIRDNNRGSYRASISTAWGTAAWSAPQTPPLPATANPAVPANQTRWLTIPQRLYFASDDTICTPATVTTMQANVPIITTVNLGAFGHTDAAIGQVSIPDLLAFLAANA